MDVSTVKSVHMRSSSKDVGNEIKDIGTVTVGGKSHSNSLILNFRPEKEAAKTKLKAMLPAHAVTLVRRAADDTNVEGLMMNGAGWETRDSDNVYVRFAEIGAEIKPLKQDRYARLAGPHSSKFDLARLDTLSPEQAVSLTARTKWDELISPTTVLLVYRPGARGKLVEFLKQYGDLARFNGPPPPDCGAPFVEEEITVAALLEFYFARKLQNSGLVARAYPLELPRTPPFITMDLRSLELTNKLKSEVITLNEKDRSIGTFFDTQLREFLVAKRPQFNTPWEVIFRNSGSILAYRWQVVGASISTCEHNRWEKFDIQVILILGEAPAVMIQVVEGYEAPSSFAQRPSDARFKENPLNDDRLAEIQNRFYGFLVKHEVGLPSFGTPSSEWTIACNL